MFLSYQYGNILPTWPIDMSYQGNDFLCYYASIPVGWFSNKCETFQLKKKKRKKATVKQNNLCLLTAYYGIIDIQ